MSDSKLPSPPAGGADPMSQGRDVGLDVGRGVLLLAMLAVHIISAHGSAAQVGWLHGEVGVFLISSGFVGLSGYVIGLRARGRLGPKMLRGLDRGLQLVLVMFGYGVLLSLARHGLSLAGGGAAACSAQSGWIPPLRFDDLGILLPIALVQIFGPTANLRGRLALITVGACGSKIELSERPAPPTSRRRASTATPRAAS